MSKPVLGMILGAALGLLDGLSAFAYPQVASQMTGIIIGSTFKGFITGVLTGYAATRLRSLPLGLLTGLVVGLFLSFVVAALPQPSGQHYYVQIMLPGGALGAIVGYATWRFGRGALPARQPGDGAARST